MGCDGGTIPRRDELVRVAKKPEQKDKEQELAFRWRHCAITQQRLQEPIVMCGLGRLYSKQNVIEHLLEKDKMPASAQHIRSLRDVRQLSMSRNPNYSSDAHKSEGGLDVRSAPFICKLIGLEMTGKYRFVALWSCGCVFSERALKEIRSSNVCSLCQQAFKDEDVVTLNGDEATVEEMLVKMRLRAASAKAEKKASKRAAAAVVAAVAATNASAAASTSASAIEINPEPSSSAAGPSKASTANASTSKPKADAASTSSKSTVRPHVKREREAGTGGRTLHKDNDMADPELKRLKQGGDFSVASDPKASDVYKSLFTTHKSEQEQTRAHWVTYNPFYN